MIFNSDNVIDKQISENFKNEDFASVQNVDHFGINVYSRPDKDYSYKIYSPNANKNYLKQLNNPVIDFLNSKNMLDFTSVIKDTSINGLKISFSVKNRSYDNLHEVFKFLNKHIPIFKNYKDEILKFSQIKYKGGDDLFFALSFVYENDVNTQFRIYWSNGTKGSRGKGGYNSSYYINQLKSSNIQNFKALATILDKIINICGGKFFISGISYTPSGPISHKVYIVFPDNAYDGIISSIPQDNALLLERLKNLKQWNSVHPEFVCDGLCINIDDKNFMNLKFFYVIDESVNKNASINENRKKSPVHDKTRELRHHYTIKPAVHKLFPEK